VLAENASFLLENIWFLPERLLKMHHFFGKTGSFFQSACCKSSGLFQKILTFFMAAIWFLSVGYQVSSRRLLGFFWMASRFLSVGLQVSIDSFHTCSIPVIDLFPTCFWNEAQFSVWRQIETKRDSVLFWSLHIYRKHCMQSAGRCEP
jgi:hypothetical protein